MNNRIEVQNDIIYTKMNIPGVEFPHKRATKTTFYELPTDEDISTTITQAKKHAYEKAANLGMTDQSSESIEEIEEYVFQSKVTMHENINEVEPEIYDSDIDDISDNFVDDVNKMAPEHPLADDASADVGNDGENEFENPPSEEAWKKAWTEVNDENGEKKFIKKSTLVWILYEQRCVSSNDRLKRFRISASRKRSHLAPHSQAHSSSETTIAVDMDIEESVE